MKTEELHNNCCCKAQTEFPQDIQKYIEDCLVKPHPESYLINILHKVQKHFGYLAPEHLEAVSKMLHVPLAKISGVATFYNLFSFAPKGKNRISVCLGTACYVKGGNKVMERLKELLNIKEGATTPDGNFSLDCARCFGACALAPVMIVNDKVYGEVKPDQLVKILSEYGFQSQV